ncbi:hypothetical protein [Olsenella sp. An293]|uniref:hypothetical protein n=1 Tax=Olsenella sp. An293 TaxID=1965626 RepID=UPI00117FBFC4|nr:hypothetical protein [Olsenella sp. An293]
MMRSIKLNGTEAGVDLIVDGSVADTFSRGEAISALSFFNALDYHAGDVYKLEDGARGPVPKGSFDPLEGLVKEIIEGINAIATEEVPVNGDSNASCESNYMADEDIPF